MVDDGCFRYQIIYWLLQMRTLCLAGGFGNILFQLNYYLNYSHCFDGFAVEGAAIHSLRRLRRLNSPCQANFLKELNFLGSAMDQAEQTLPDYCLLKYSSVVNQVCRGRYWNNFIAGSELESIPGVFHFKTYGQYLVPVHENLLRIIKNNIVARRAYLLQLPKAYDYVAHVRGGDLARTSRIGDYYSRLAIRRNANILVVTNDIEHAKIAFNKYANCNFLSSESIYDDFAIISSGRRLILSNSTFAWWAAEVSSACEIIQPSDFKLGPHFSPLSNVKRNSI